MDFALLNNLPFIQEISGETDTCLYHEIICQYISYSMLLNSDSHLTAEVGAEHI